MPRLSPPLPFAAGFREANLWPAASLLLLGVVQGLRLRRRASHQAQIYGLLFEKTLSVFEEFVYNTRALRFDGNMDHIPPRGVR